MLIFFVAGTVLYCLFKFHSREENWCYYIAGGFFMTISVYVPIDPVHPLLRTYFMVFCIYGLLLTTTFNSFFMSTITKPIKSTQISTKEGLINNSMELYAENETFSLYNTGSSEVVN